MCVGLRGAARKTPRAGLDGRNRVGSASCLWGQCSLHDLPIRIPVGGTSGVGSEVTDHAESPMASILIAECIREICIALHDHRSFAINHPALYTHLGQDGGCEDSQHFSVLLSPAQWANPGRFARHDSIRLNRISMEAPSTADLPARPTHRLACVTGSPPARNSCCSVTQTFWTTN